MVQSLYSNDVKNNIGKKLFWLLSNHFPSHHNLCKICNKICVKLTVTTPTYPMLQPSSPHTTKRSSGKQQQNRIRSPATAEINQIVP